MRVRDWILKAEGGMCIDSVKAEGAGVNTWT